MDSYTVRNCVSYRYSCPYTRHEGIKKKSGDIAPLILNYGTRWRLVSVTPPAASPPYKEPPVPAE
jgi:hypothetical protein